MVCPFREGGAAVGSDYGWSQLNGVYAMLCSAMWAWYRLGHDVMRAKAARALKDVYGYELHLNGGGCPWRLPGVDMDRAKAMMAALGLDPARFDGNAVALARLLDGSRMITPPTRAGPAWWSSSTTRSAGSRPTGTRCWTGG